MKVRSGLTAIAVVLALSSTPLGAQEVTAPPDPVTETPAEPAPTADPLAPEPAASESAATGPAASEAEPAAAAPPRRAAARSRTAATNRSPNQAVRTTAPATAAQTAVAAADPAIAPSPPAAPVAGPVAPPTAEPAAAVNDLLTDESMPVAGAAGLGLLALGGLGLALQSRRRRREAMEHHRAAQQYLDEHPAEPMPATPEPGFLRANRPASVAAAPGTAVRTDVPRTTLPNGFDLSRFGPHVRAAYLGPTPDNPSLSLKYRLRRAAAMDQRARLEAEARPQAEQPAKRPEPARQQPAWSVNREGFMLRRAGSGRPARPAFQK